LGCIKGANVFLCLFREVSLSQAGSPTFVLGAQHVSGTEQKIFVFIERIERYCIWLERDSIY